MNFINDGGSGFRSARLGGADKNTKAVRDHFCAGRCGGKDGDPAEHGCIKKNAVRAGIGADMLQNSVVTQTAGGRRNMPPEKHISGDTEDFPQSIFFRGRSFSGCRGALCGG